MHESRISTFEQEFANLREQVGEVRDVVKSSPGWPAVMGIVITFLGGMVFVVVKSLL
jgi:hypothetical protein